MSERKYLIMLTHDGNIETLEFDNPEEWFDDAKKRANIIYAEPIYPFGPKYVCLIDEDGKSRELPMNKKATLLYINAFHVQDYIVGNMLISHKNEEISDMELLNAEEVEKFKKYFGII